MTRATALRDLLKHYDLGVRAVSARDQSPAARTISTACGKLLAVWPGWNAVSGHGVPVVLSLHPLCDAARYDFAEDKYGVFICRDYKIHELYPFCAFSISFPCSTNLLASMFKKPLVIYDFFGLTNTNADSALMHALPGACIAVDIQLAMKNFCLNGS